MTSLARQVCSSFTAVLSLGLLVACATAPREFEAVTAEAALPSAPAPNESLFAGTSPIPEPETLIELSPQQKADFLVYFHSEAAQSLPQHHRIRQYLEQKLRGFGYLEATLTASEALAQHRGNCASLAALTLALADLVGIETHFQLMTTAPVFDREGGLILSSNHVRSRVYDPDYEPTPGKLSLLRPHVLIDYFPGDRMGRGAPLSRAEFLALIYRNLAADALIAGDLDRAFALSRAALALDPDHADSLNLMAVIHRRAGDLQSAEDFYRYAIVLHDNQVNLLSNYENLLRRQGRHSEADKIESRLARLDDPNPFHWLDLGERARQRGSLHTALRWYGEALERAPYLHEAYWRQAIVYQALGQPDRSMAALKKAHSLTRHANIKERYQAKLYGLRADHN